MGMDTLAWIFATIVSPLITQLIKKWNIGKEFSTAINVVLATSFYVGFWYVTKSGDPTLFEAYFMAGLAAGGVGTAGFNMLKSGSKKIVGG